MACRWSYDWPLVPVSVAGDWQQQETVFCEAEFHEPAWMNILSSLALAVSGWGTWAYWQTVPQLHTQATNTVWALYVLAINLTGVASAVYHAYPYRLFRAWDNWCLQWSMFWLSMASALFLSSQTYPGTAAVPALLRPVRWVTVWLMALYWWIPEWVFTLQLGTVIWFGILSLYWTHRSLFHHPHVWDMRWRWRVMAGLCLVSALAFELERRYCHSATWFAHGIFHTTLAGAVFYFTTFFR